MDDSINFNDILSLSKKLESERMEREIDEVMLDEYELDADLQNQLKEGTYHFPNVTHTKTDKQILTRVQSQFSAKVHICQTPFYFHKHDFIEILYVYQGECKQFIESLDNCLVLQEGDLFMLNQNVTHALLQEDEDAVLIKIVVPVSWISHDFIRNIEHENHLYDFFVNAKSERKEYYHYLQFQNCFGEGKLLIERIMREYYLQQQHSEAAIQSCLQLLMIFLERKNEEYSNIRYKIAHSSLQTGKIMQYIYDHSETVTLEELSQKFSFNQSYLSRIIKGNCNMNFQDLVRKCRLEKAAILLENSKCSVEKIALMVGYQNAIPVYKGIKEKYGISPTKYRKLHSKNKIDNISNE